MSTPKSVLEMAKKSGVKMGGYPYEFFLYYDV